MSLQCRQIKVYLDKRFSLGLIHLTKWAVFEPKLLIRAPMEILNWVATVAGLRRIDRFMLPSGKRVLRSGCSDWNITAERSRSSRSEFFATKPSTE